MPIEYHYVLWSGNNSHESRLTAAIELSKHVGEISRRSPRTPHYLICHSHGGNIALYAAKDRAFVEAVSGLVTLGTPFIRCAPNRIVSLFSNKINYIQTIILGIFCAALLPVVILDMISKPEFLKRLVGDWDDFVWMTPLLFGFSVLFVKAGLLTQRRLENFAVRLRNVQTNAVKKLTPARFLGSRLLIARIHTDEAGWWLSRISGIGRIPHKFNRFLDLLAVAMYFPRIDWGLAIATVGLAIADPIGLREQGWSGQSAGASFILGGFLAFGLSLAAEAVGLAATMLTITAAVTLPLFATTVRSHKFGFGAERILQAASIDIYTESIPQVKGPLPRVVNVSSRRFFGLFGGLRHSVFYDSPSVVSAIATWINSKELQRERVEA